MKIPTFLSQDRYRGLLLLSLALMQLPLLIGYRSSGPLFIVGAVLFSLCAWKLFQLKELPNFSELVVGRFFWCYWGVFLCSYLALSFVHYYSFEFNNFDTGIYANQIAHLNFDGRYYSSILQFPALGEHFTPLLMIFAPLLQWTGSFLALPLLKVLAVFICPILLLLLSKEVLGASSRLIYFAPLLWVVHKYLAKVLEMEFQPSTLVLPVIIGAFLFARRGRWLPSLACLVILLGAKEHLALIWLSLGAYCWLFLQRKTLGLILVVSGVAFGLLIYLGVMPHFAGGLANSHADRFAPFAFIPEKAELVFMALASVAFLPLLAPKSLLFLLPAFGIAFVSGDPLMLEFSHHYQDIGLAVLFVALIEGLKEAEKLLLDLSVKSRVVCLCGCALLLLLFHTRYPARRIKKDWPTGQEIQLVEELREFRVRAKPEKQLWALDFLGPYLFDHPNLRTITHPERIDLSQRGTLLVYSSLVKQWPLEDSQVQMLRRRIESELKQKRLKRLNGFDLLEVYRVR